MNANVVISKTMKKNVKVATVGLTYFNNLISVFVLFVQFIDPCRVRIIFVVMYEHVLKVISF